MISSSWGAPEAFTKGFDLQHVSDAFYGKHLHVYSWPEGELKQTMDLGNTGKIPLDIRFLHDPSKDIGFVGCALTSNMVRFFKTANGSWYHEVAISVEPLKVKNWILPQMPGLITDDFLISLDDRFLYFVNWMHGDIRQYNIEDPKKPVITGQVWVEGLLQKGSHVIAELEDGKEWQSDVPEVKLKLLYKLQRINKGERSLAMFSKSQAWTSKPPHSQQATLTMGNEGNSIFLHIWNKFVR